jgi:hypothetical protein
MQFVDSLRLVDKPFTDDAVPVQIKSDAGTLFSESTYLVELAKNQLTV